MKLKDPNVVICERGYYLLPDKITCMACFYTCKTCNGIAYDKCLECQDRRGDSNFSSIIGTCSCHDLRSEDSNGVCVESQSAVLVENAISVMFILEMAIGIIIVMVNKKFFLMYQFIDAMQQLSQLFYINVYYPSNLDLIF